MNTEELKRKIDALTIKFNQVSSSCKNDLNSDILDNIDYYISDYNNTLLTLESFLLSESMVKNLEEINRNIEVFDRKLSAILASHNSNDDIGNQADEMFKEALKRARYLLTQAQRFSHENPSLMKLETRLFNNLKDMRKETLLDAYRIDNNLSEEDQARQQTKIWLLKTKILDEDISAIESLLVDIEPAYQGYVRAVIEFEANLAKAKSFVNIAEADIYKQPTIASSQNTLQNMIKHIQKSTTNQDFFKTSFEDRTTYLTTHNSILQQENIDIEEKIRIADDDFLFEHTNIATLIADHHKKYEFSSFLTKLDDYFKRSPDKIENLLVNFNEFLGVNNLNIDDENLAKLIEFFVKYKSYCKSPVSSIENLIDINGIFLKEGQYLNSDSFYRLNSGGELALSLAILKENHVKMTYKILDGLIKNPDICQVVIQQDKQNKISKRLNPELFGRFLANFINNASGNPNLAKAMRHVGEKVPDFCEPWLLVFSQYHSQFITILNNETNFDNNLFILNAILGETKLLDSYALSENGYLSSDAAQQAKAIEHIQNYWVNKTLEAESLQSLAAVQNTNACDTEIKRLANCLININQIVSLDTDEKKRECKGYCQKISPILLDTNCDLDNKVKRCDQLARHTFKHVDRGWRIALDIFLVITTISGWIALANMYQKKDPNPFFSREPTPAQKAIHQLLTTDSNEPDSSYSPAA